MNLFKVNSLEKIYTIFMRFFLPFIHQVWFVLLSGLCLSLGVSHQAYSAEMTLDLITAYELAVRHDPQMASARFENLASKELKSQSLALFLPTITATASANKNEGDRKNFNTLPSNLSYLGSSKTNYDGYNYAITLKQPIINLENFYRYQQNMTQMSRADKQLIRKQQELMLRVSETYLDVMIVKNQSQLLVQQKKAIEDQLSLAEAKFEAGLVSVVDINESKAKLALLRVQEIAVEQNIKIKLRAMQSLIGEMPTNIMMLRPDTTFIRSEDSMEQWLDIAMGASLQVQMKQDELMLAHQTIGLKKSSHYPTLNAVLSRQKNWANGGYPYGTLDNKGQAVESDLFGVEVNIPIFSGGLTESQVREAQFNEEKVNQDFEATLKQVQFEVRQQYLSLESSYKQIEAYQSALKISKDQLDATILGFQEGMRNSIEVLNAQQTLFGTEKDLFEIRCQYLLTLFKLKLAAGLIKETDIQEINRYLSS
ncbi:TolC Outer membrane protein [Candidatus Methylopumilus planktonicus]|uniref:TolC family outer membrane protein n=1 Tax=Candidatus Methylopumilus planktonicus TaxID=1581557 RepID=UPI003BEEDFE3